MDFIDWIDGKVLWRHWRAPAPIGIWIGMNNCFTWNANVNYIQQIFILYCTFNNRYCFLHHRLWSAILCRFVFLCKFIELSNSLSDNIIFRFMYTLSQESKKRVVRIFPIWFGFIFITLSHIHVIRFCVWIYLPFLFFAKCDIGITHLNPVSSMPILYGFAFPYPCERWNVSATHAYPLSPSLSLKFSVTSSDSVNVCHMHSAYVLI